MPDRSGTYDVVVAGGGNAGLCAAIAARQRGARVLLIEQAPRALRGGNTRHALNLRVAHGEPGVYVRDTYPADEYRDELIRVTGGNTDQHLARLLIEGSMHIMDWMEQCGVHFMRSYDRRSPPARKTAFLLGGGKALLNAYYRTAESLGIAVLYDAEVLSLRLDEGIAREVTVVANGLRTQVRAKSVVVASGGCQADLGWRGDRRGEASDDIVIRGTPYARGRLLKNLLDQKVRSVGDPARCHMVAVDARAPKFDGGIVTRLDGLPFGIVVDRNSRRFHDEGEHIGRARYAVWGRLVAECPGQIAYSIFDAKAERFFRRSIYPAIRAQTIEALAARLSLDPATLARTVREFNDAVAAAGDRNGAGRNRTCGLTPPKSRWALPIATPPFDAYPLRPGITFSYLGVRIDQRARVMAAHDRPVANLFAAGAIMTANVLGEGYLAGLGLTIGTVFGRLAGCEAANYANQHRH